jgi:hypothetical protein
MTNRVGPLNTVRRPLAESEDGPDKKRQNRSTLTTSDPSLTFSLVHLPVGSPAMPANSPYTFVNQGPHPFEMGPVSTVQKVKRKPLPLLSPGTQPGLYYPAYIPLVPVAAASSSPSPSPAAASSSSSAPLPALSPAASKQLPKEERLPDGSIVRELPNGAIMRRYPNGKIELSGKNQVRNVPVKSDFEIKFEETQEQMRIQMVAKLKEVEETRRRYLPLPPPPIQFGNPPIQVQSSLSGSSTRHEDTDEADSNSDSEIPSIEHLTINDTPHET